VGPLGLGLGSELHVVGRLGSGPRVGAGVISGGCNFGRRVVSGGGELFPRIYKVISAMAY